MSFHYFVTFNIAVHELIFVLGILLDRRYIFINDIDDGILSKIWDLI